MLNRLLSNYGKDNDSGSCSAREGSTSSSASSSSSSGTTSSSASSISTDSSTSTLSHSPSQSQSQSQSVFAKDYCLADKLGYDYNTDCQSENDSDFAQCKYESYLLDENIVIPQESRNEKGM